MMAARSYRVSPACSWLIRAFSPGCPTQLRCWSSRKVIGGERLTIIFDLPDGKARLRAAEIARTAPTAELVEVGGKALRDLTAVVEADRLTVEALLVRP